MSLLVDTHTHLFVSQFDTDRQAVVERALAVCAHLVLPNIDADTVEAMDALSLSYPGRVWSTIGLHPCHVDASWPKVLKGMEAKAFDPFYIGIGECGTDLYWDKTNLPAQLDALRLQLDWARQTGKPVILHCRESVAPTLALVSEMQDGRLKGIFHCWSGTPEQAREAEALGFHLGIGGPITNKNNQQMVDSVRAVALESLVLETDSPYLAPAPHKRTRNESAYIALVAEKLAQELALDLHTVASTTTATACKLFGLAV